MRFFLLPSGAVALFIYGLHVPLTLIGSEVLWDVVVLTLFPFVFIAPLAAMFYMTFGEHVAVPRWLIPRWSYDPELGHPFHIKIYKVKRKSD